MATTPRGYPIFTGGMPPAAPVQMQQLAEAIDEDMTETTFDTGRVTAGIAYLNGFGAGNDINGFRSLTYRRVGKTVWVNGLIRRAAAWAGGIQALTMPLGARPDRQTLSSEGYIDESGRLYLYTAGLADGQVNITISYAVA